MVSQINPANKKKSGSDQMNSEGELKKSSDDLEPFSIKPEEKKKKFGFFWLINFYFSFIIYCK